MGHVGNVMASAWGAHSSVTNALGFVGRVGGSAVFARVPPILCDVCEFVHGVLTRSEMTRLARINCTKPHPRGRAGRGRDTSQGVPRHMKD